MLRIIRDSNLIEIREEILTSTMKYTNGNKMYTFYSTLECVEITDTGVTARYKHLLAFGKEKKGVFIEVWLGNTKFRVAFRNKFPYLIAGFKKVSLLEEV